MRDAGVCRAVHRSEPETDSTLPAGTLQTYAKRGWCRLEILAALAPKKFWRGEWRPGPRNLRFRYPCVRRADDDDNDDGDDDDDDDDDETNEDDENNESDENEEYEENDEGKVAKSTPNYL